jgi:hypothetical protein
MKKIIKIIIFFIFLSNHLQADVVDQLNKLNDLFKAGVISKEEFTKGKSIILNTKEATIKKEVGKKKIINKKKEKSKELLLQTQEVTETTKEIKKKEIVDKVTQVIQKRSAKEIKLGIFLSDLEQIGNFKEINYAPEGMFPEQADNFSRKQSISQRQFIKTFVTQKGQMEKYTDRVILGMAHFEFFYMQQLKENARSIKRFKETYPKVNAAIKKDIAKVYGLSKAKKSMREALGLSLNDSPDVAIKRYYVLYKLLNQAEIKTIKLSTEEKSRAKLHNKISKNVSMLKSLTDDRFNERLTDKKFNKKYAKIFKKLSRNLKRANHIKDYELVTSFILELDKYKDTKPSQVLSGFKITEFILQNLKKEKITKKFEQDLSNASFDDFTQDELSILGDVTNTMKINKNIKSNDIQLQILNLENGDIPVNRFLDTYRNELNVNLDTIHLQVASASKMKDWKLNDWANAWKNPIPKSIIDNAGIEISLSPDEMQSIKAQLAMQNFKEILDLDDFRDIIQNESDNFSDIQKNLDLNSQSFKFSFTLDDFAKSFGDTYGIDINNYSDLTDLANAQHGANWSVEEYASAYQANVDVVNALQSGSLSSFDAGQIAREANTSLQEVADTITAATSAGVSVDLEATAQGLGYGSFADAVNAYNAENGTNYTEAEAKEALGQ